jgi:hypothetical protein
LRLSPARTVIAHIYQGVQERRQDERKVGKLHLSRIPGVGGSPVLAVENAGPNKKR